MGGRGVAGGDDAVGDADPALRAGGHRGDTPTEVGRPGDHRQVVGPGLEQRHLPGQELIQEEIAVVVGGCSVSKSSHTVKQLLFGFHLKK